MDKTDSLIRTKLRLPFTRPELISRPRLQEQIAQGLRLPLTLVTAPAGFGKTTLVASCLVGCGLPVAWLSLDKNDNQVERFLRYLVAALQGADPGIGSEAAQLVQGIQPALPEAVLISLINDLDTNGREMALALDDYQFIHSQSVHDAMAFLLAHSPPALHLVMATRSDPPLPLARLRARGQTAELRAADLRFTGIEAAQFLDQVMGLHLDAASAAALAARTEGWAAGLQMAGLSMRDREDTREFIAGFSGTNRYIMDYLLEEVLTGQPPEVQDFLLHTAILGRLAAPLCDALLAEDEASTPGAENSVPASAPSPGSSAAILAYLERANLFLVPLDDEGTWYRYHHLFADLLRNRLQQAQPDLVPRLHIRASTWLEQAGWITEAIQHRFAAGEIGHAADLIERYGPHFLAKSDPSILQLAEGLPHEILLAHPRIGLYHAWFFIIQGRIEKALRLLHDLQRAFTAATPDMGLDAGQSWIHVIAALALAFLAPPASAQAAEPLPDYAVLDDIPPEELVLRNAADFLYGMALTRRGEFERAVEVALTCIQREKSSQRAATIPTLAPFLTRIYLMQGRLHAAASLCREFLDPIQEQGFRFVYTAGSIKIDLGEVLSEWNYLDQAEQYIRDGLQANQPWNNIMTEAFGLVVLARILQAKGDYAGALQTVEQFEARLHELPRPREFEEEFHTLKVRLQCTAGDVQGASQWANQVQHSQHFNLHPELYRFTLAHICLAQGRYAEVQQLLARLVYDLTSGSRIARQLEANLLLAVAAARQQRLPEAMEIIAASLALAEPEGYVRIFIDVGEPVRDLLAAYLRSEAPGHRPYAQKILDAFSPPLQATPPSPQPNGLIEALSGRELEVLHLIAQGCTNQMIAQQLIVAPGTIKAHAASIYRKLEVTNRTEAVARARQLGILP